MGRVKYGVLVGGIIHMCYSEKDALADSRDYLNGVVMKKVDEQWVLL